MAPAIVSYRDTFYLRQFKEHISRIPNFLNNVSIHIHIQRCGGNFKVTTLYFEVHEKENFQTKKNFFISIDSHKLVFIA